MSKIAIQGNRGSFHELAARKYFGKTKGLLFCQTFLEVFEALETGAADSALAAIGNNRYGDINHVYDILISNHLNSKNINKYWISGEVYININHCLVGLKDTKLEDIKEVYSQAPAIVQCFSYIHNNLRGTISIETDDTALSAKLIHEWNDKTKVAIASKQAAKQYGLKVLAEGIQDDINNITRFLIIEPHKIKDSKDASKTSMLLRTTHKPGALVQALKLFADNELNLSYLQSIPIPNRPFEYRFYIDIDGGIHDDKLVSAINGLDDLGYQYDILGSYKQAKIPKVIS